MGVVYFSIIPTFEPSRYCKCWIVCFDNIILKNDFNAINAVKGLNVSSLSDVPNMRKKANVL